ncbi:MAG: Asp-tRNA(Asn)/Glu-tRNA(Gln) amidotransferase subunit GatB, partial [Dehalococcoidia bacterium]|nr:Asp-tRNA(Asn)/Glu-tRNA(Gln) amidotransferase subunit GatB [Dehalococcoidia bacterium]
SVETGGENKRIGITRVHLEEDVAKLSHRHNSLGESYSVVDVNRAGVPLMEIVSEPDIRSPEQARQYLMKLRTLLQYLGVSTGNMEEGSFRCDANISIRPRGSLEYQAKVEVKNMNSFKAVHRALTFEEERQRRAVESDERIIQETRGWVEEKGVTVSQRSKESAHDYRYFPEPDLPPLVVSGSWVDEVRSKLPELPEQRCDRFMRDYELSAYDAGLLTGSKAMADYFEACLNGGGVTRNASDKPKKAKTLGNWLLGEFTRLLNATNNEITGAKVSPAALNKLLELIEEGKINLTAGKAVFEEMFNTGKPAAEIVEERGLVQVSDRGDLERVIKEVIAKNSKAVDDFRAGKEQASGFLVGQVMRATRGRANAKIVQELLHAILSE